MAPPKDGIRPICTCGAKDWQRAKFHCTTRTSSPSSLIKSHLPVPFHEPSPNSQSIPGANAYLSHEVGKAKGHEGIGAHVGDLLRVQQRIHMILPAHPAVSNRTPTAYYAGCMKCFGRSAVVPAGHPHDLSSTSSCERKDHQRLVTTEKMLVNLLWSSRAPSQSFLNNQLQPTNTNVSCISFNMGTKCSSALRDNSRLTSFPGHHKQHQCMMNHLVGRISP